ncbi:biotin transport system permease protein [Lipingzhangella halophila]|uniref:Biotin transport system permease protein n=1 Tax=Lipingzhangella halophila TaxID=1783352 RepID=A0A7W7RDQ5_9ACTN|nr:energy-coupling factor transporter transmembrane protein EcfT [Lipingzhangella halophila]MBB4930112.1 biotin transport system permease protein [Lipingzhangella halophila]
MSVLGLYLPGDSVLHRTPAGVKLLALLGAVTAVVVLGDPWIAVGAAVGCALLYPLCGLRAGHAWRILRPLLPFLVLIVLFQMLGGDALVAVRTCAQLVLAVLLSGLVTFTTRVSTMLALFERVARPLRFAGVRPDRLALVLALTIRALPMVAAAWHASREAYLARGLRGRPHLMVVPVIVGLVRSAEAMGDAMTARGLD